MKTMSEEHYLAINGASRQDIGESALHKNRGKMSDKAWHKIVLAQADKDHDLIIRRGKLRKEYQEKITTGEIKAPTAVEQLKATATGLPELLAVQAARRILERKGIDWKAFTPVENYVCPF